MQLSCYAAFKKQLKLSCSCFGLVSVLAMGDKSADYHLVIEDPLCSAWTVPQEKPEVLEGVPLERWTAWVAEVTRLLQTFRKTGLIKLFGGIFLIVWSASCLLVFVLAFMTLTEDATWVSIIALMAGVVMCAIAPIVFLMTVCCEASARGKIDQLCSDLAKERPGMSIRVDERAWNPGKRDIGKFKKNIIFSQRSSQVGSDQEEADAQAEPEAEGNLEP